MSDNEATHVPVIVPEKLLLDMVELGNQIRDGDIIAEESKKKWLHQMAKIGCAAFDDWKIS